MKQPVTIIPILQNGGTLSRAHKIIIPLYGILYGMWPCLLITFPEPPIPPIVMGGIILVTALPLILLLALTAIKKYRVISLTYYSEFLIPLVSPRPSALMGILICLSGYYPGAPFRNDRSSHWDDGYWGTGIIIILLAWLLAEGLAAYDAYRIDDREIRRIARKEKYFADGPSPDIVHLIKLGGWLNDRQYMTVTNKIFAPVMLSLIIFGPIAQALAVTGKLGWGIFRIDMFVIAFFGCLTFATYGMQLGGKVLRRAIRLKERGEI